MRVYSSLRRTLAVPLLVALTACGGGLDYYSGPPPEMVLRGPEVAPDGTAILLAFQFRNYAPKLAAIPTAPDGGDLVVFQAPPGLLWRDPTWSPDGDWFAAVSWCEGPDCYEGATGYNVWRLEIDGPTMERMSPVKDGVRRRDPVFGTSGDEIYYVESSTEFDGVGKYDIADRSLIRVQHGHVQEIFPAPLETIDFMNLQINASVAQDRWVFVGMVSPNGDHPFVDELIDNGFKWHDAMFSFGDGTFQLEKPFKVVDVHISRTNPGYVFVRNVYPENKLRFEFYLSENGEDRLLFDYANGHVKEISVSDDLKHLVFRGQRQFNGPWAIWHYNIETGVLTDLQVPERLTKEVLRQIDEERGLRSAEAANALQ